MGYFSDFYLDNFSSDVLRKFVILTNQIQIHNKQRYLLIVAQDLVTHKVVRFVDTHGLKYDLYKYSDEWAKLKKGDIVKVRCAFYESKKYVNVLRVICDYQWVGSIDFYESLREIWKNSKYNLKNTDLAIQVNYTDVEYIGKKLNGRYGFMLYPLKNEQLIKYAAKDKKTKYQFTFISRGKIYYADIVPYVPNIEIRIDDFYHGIVLLQFAFKDGRLRLKVYDFLNDGENFSEPRFLVESETGVMDDDLPF